MTDNPTPSLPDEMVALFMPSIRAGASYYALHHWKMEGRVVAKVISVREYRPELWSFAAGRLVPMPPKSLLNAVRRWKKKGVPVNAPLGWRKGGYQ